MPKAEVIVWSYIKNKKIDGQRFLRQYSIDKYVADFYCPQLHLVIEIDGHSHYESEKAEKYDRTRSEYFESLGLTVLRVTNYDVYKSIGGVIDAIFAKIKELKKEG
jgi:very-short-patch-repair endonuclease